jgi:hypothetical protein
MELVWGLLGLVVLGVIVLIPQAPVTYALQKKGKWLKAIEFVNGLCVAVAGLAVAYCCVYLDSRGSTIMG